MPKAKPPLGSHPCLRAPFSSASQRASYLALARAADHVKSPERYVALIEKFQHLSAPQLVVATRRLEVDAIRHEQRLRRLHSFYPVSSPALPNPEAALLYARRRRLQSAEADEISRRILSVAGASGPRRQLIRVMVECAVGFCAAPTDQLLFLARLVQLRDHRPPFPDLRAYFQRRWGFSAPAWHRACHDIRRRLLSFRTLYEREVLS